MKKKTFKIICITAGAIAAIGAGITAFAYISAKKEKKS